MSLYSRFSQHNALLRGIDLTARQGISELVFSCRDGQLSLCVVFSDVMALRSVIGTVPDVIEQANGNRFGVDLESIGTDRLRLYIDGQDGGESIRGFYFDQDLQMDVLKKYKRADGFGLLIDRYDGSGNLISPDEPESASDSSCWTGPQEIMDAAIDAQQDHSVIFLEKGDKNQNYIRIVS